MATLVSGIVGVLLGVLAAVRAGGVGKAVNTGSGIALSLPAFWTAILFVYVCLDPAQPVPRHRLRRLR